MSKIKINIKIKPELGLTIKIVTSRLSILSYKPEHLPNMVEIFNDENVMRSFGSGKVYSEVDITRASIKWLESLKRCDVSDNIKLMVFERATVKFIGFISMHSGAIGYALHSEAQGKGYGTEVLHAVVRELIPRLVNRKNELSIDKLSMLTATALLTNMASKRILEKVGFKIVEEIERYGASRYSYQLPIIDITRDFFNSRSAFFQRSPILPWMRSLEETADIKATEFAGTGFAPGL